MRMYYNAFNCLRAIALLALLLVGAGANGAMAQEVPSSPRAMTIEITTVPPSGSGAQSWGKIGGKTAGADPSEHRVVIYARTNQWYVQPWVADPFTSLRKDGTFQSGTHLGLEYAVLLVDHSFVPQPTLGDLPGVGPGILVVTHVNAAGR